MVKTKVMNRFEIVERLGTGGFGTVYRAWDQRLEREVAVKVIETEAAPAARTRREAQAAARLNHPGIVGLYEFVQHEFGPGDGRAFLVSELVEGPTLRQLIDDGVLGDREIAGIGIEVARSLEHAHSRGVVHRDVKPSNLIRSEETGQTKLMDFGIARVAGVAELTAAGDVLGTLAYMSPEQADGIEAGPEADVYSLGLVLFEAWTGVNPRRGRTAGETVLSATVEVSPLSAYRPDLPSELTDLIDECLELDPAWRPSAAELAEGITASIDQLEEEIPQRESAEPRPTSTDDRGWPVRVATGLAMTAATATVLTVAGVGDLASIVATSAAAGLASLASPRIGFPLAGIVTAAWLGLAGDLWGAALAILMVWVLPGLVAGSGVALLAVPLSPLAGLVSLAPVGAVLAAFAPRPRDRVLVASASLLAVAGIEAISGRRLLFGDMPKAGADWANDPLSLVTDLLWPVVTTPSFPVALAVWAIVALLGGVLIEWLMSRRGRQAPRALEVSGVGSRGVTDVR